MGPSIADPSRRSAIVGALAAGAAGLANAQAFDFKPNQRYPGPAVQVLDPSFAEYRLFSSSSSSVEQIATGFRWVEGPVWFGDGRYLPFSDIPNNRIMGWEEATGQTGVFRNPSNFSNGLGRNRQGCLLACEHLPQRVTRTEYDGSITVLADRFEGERLDSLDEKQLYLVDRTAEGRRQTMASSHSVYSLYAETRASV